MAETYGKQVVFLLIGKFIKFIKATVIIIYWLYLF